MATPTRILLIDAPGAGSTAVRSLLATAGHHALYVADAEHAACVADDAIDVVLLAAPLASERTVAQLTAAAGGSPVVLLTTTGDPADGLRRFGAHDLAPRDGGADALLQVVEQAARLAGMRREIATLRARVGERALESLVGRSVAIERVRELVGRAASSRITVLVTGESGTGKDVVARMIHDLSPRAGEPFVSVRCAGVDPVALERELFGGPGARAPGLLIEARGGTIVLDEYAAIPPALQARIARVIAERAVTRAGATRPVGARLVLTRRDYPGATPIRPNADHLLAEVQALLIALPPLRERRADIPPLVQHFRARLARELPDVLAPLAPDAMLALMSQEWPGNVRELEHYVERRAREALPRGVPSFDRPLTLQELEREYILHVLDQAGGHQSRAAERLGIDRRTLYRKLKEYRGGERVA